MRSLRRRDESRGARGRGRRRRPHHRRRPHPSPPARSTDASLARSTGAALSGGRASCVTRDAPRPAPLREGSRRRRGDGGGSATAAMTASAPSSLVPFPHALPPPSPACVRPIPRSQRHASFVRTREQERSEPAECVVTSRRRGAALAGAPFPGHVWRRWIARGCSRSPPSSPFLPASSFPPLPPARAVVARAGASSQSGLSSLLPCLRPRVVRLPRGDARCRNRRASVVPRAPAVLEASWRAARIWRPSARPSSAVRHQGHAPRAYCVRLCTLHLLRTSRLI